ncbi:MAG: RNA polymerase sigma factor [Bacteroidota bacterium]
MRKSFPKEILEKHSNRLIAKGVSPETLLDIEILYKAMDRLPAPQKEVLILFEISGFSIREIAEIQNTTVGAVKTKISRARKKLKEYLTERLADRFDWARVLRHIASNKMIDIAVHFIICLICVIGKK